MATAARTKPNSYLVPGLDRCEKQDRAARIRQSSIGDGPKLVAPAESLLYPPCREIHASCEISKGHVQKTVLDIGRLGNRHVHSCRVRIRELIQNDRHKTPAILLCAVCSHGGCSCCRPGPGLGIDYFYRMTPLTDLTDESTGGYAVSFGSLVNVLIWKNPPTLTTERVTRSDKHEKHLGDNYLTESAV